MKENGNSRNFERIWLFSANKIKNPDSFSKQPTQLIAVLNSSLQHIIVKYGDMMLSYLVKKIFVEWWKKMGELMSRTRYLIYLWINPPNNFINNHSPGQCMIICFWVRSFIIWKMWTLLFNELTNFILFDIFCPGVLKANSCLYRSILTFEITD